MADPKKITKAPDSTVQNLSVSRDGATWKSSWTNPKHAASDQNEARWQGLTTEWSILKAGDKAFTVKATTKRGADAKSGSLSLPLTDFYPNKAAKLKKVRFSVWGTNTYTDKKGKQHDGKGAATTVVKELSVPVNPSMSLSYDGNGRVLCKWSSNTGGANAKGMRPRYETVLRHRHVRYRDGKVFNDSGWSSALERTATSGELRHDATGEGTLADNERITYMFEATNKGAAGDSVRVQEVYRIGKPNQPTISGIEIADKTDLVDGIVVIWVNLNKGEFRPVDTCTLQRLSNAPANYSTMQAAGSDDWEDVATDNGNCSGFHDSLVNAISDQGTYTWYRVVASRAEYDSYSEPVRVNKTFVKAPTAVGDEVAIVSAKPTNEGDTLEVVVGWGNDDSTANEISWSSNPNAWESTSEPTLFLFEWKDKTSKSPDWANTATVYVTGLTEGTPYYLRVRRYLEDEVGTVTRSEWAEHPEPVTPVSVPTDVVLSLPDYLANGDDLTVSWSYTGSVQQGYELFDAAGNVWAAGFGDVRHAVVPWNEVEERAAEDGTVSLAVRVTTGGGWAASAFSGTGIAEAPTVSVSAELDEAPAGSDTLYPDILAAQPLRFTVTTDKVGDVLVSAFVESEGNVAAFPDGQKSQPQGYVVWSDASQQVSSTGSEFSPSLSFELPVAEFRDGCDYVLRVRATDSETGLESEEASVPFSVLWSHQAEAPTADVTVNADGSATVSPIAAATAAETDVADIYRVTPSGAYVIAEGVEFGGEAVDPFPAFSSTWGGPGRYAVMARTADGDVDWSVVDFDNENKTVRFDWEAWDGWRSLELPYNVEVNDKWGKRDETRVHADGSKELYAMAGADHSVSVSASIRRDMNEEQREELVSLAMHEGPVFVRTPDGQAYPARVTVDGLGSAYKTSAADVSITAEEVGMSARFEAVTDGLD